MSEYELLQDRLNAAYTRAEKAERSERKNRIVLRDATLEIVRLRGEVERAGEDPVTTLPTRRASERFAVEAWDRAARHDGVIGVGMIDIDFFKLINDEAGHKQGDRILRQVALEIRESMRASEFLGRWGGDEFVLISEGASRKSLERGALRIIEHVRFNTPVTVSIGLGLENDTDLNTLEVLERADANLLLVKAAGKDGYRL